MKYYGRQLNRGMRAARLLVIASFLTISQALGQQQVSANADAAFNFDLSSPFLPKAVEFTPPPNSDAIAISKRLQIEGPLVAPIKSKKLWDFPKRIVQMLNPFSKSGHAQETADYAPVESRAWSTMAGWRPGRSAFLDDTEHEPQLRLLSIHGGSGD